MLNHISFNHKIVLAIIIRFNFNWCYIILNHYPLWQVYIATKVLLFSTLPLHYELKFEVIDKNAPSSVILCKANTLAHLLGIFSTSNLIKRCQPTTPIPCHRLVTLFTAGHVMLDMLYIVLLSTWELYRRTSWLKHHAENYTGLLLNSLCHCV